MLGGCCRFELREKMKSTRKIHSPTLTSQFEPRCQAKGHDVSQWTRGCLSERGRLDNSPNECWRITMPIVPTKSSPSVEQSGSRWTTRTCYNEQSPNFASGAANAVLAIRSAA